MSIRHGAYVVETDTFVGSPDIVSSGAIVVVGTAPVFQLDNPGAVTNTPVLCNTYEDAVEKLGFCDDFDTYTLCQMMYLTKSKYPVGPIVYINVLDCSTMKKTAEDVSFTHPVKSRIVVEKPGAIKSLVTVKQGSTTLVKDTDYTLEYDTSGNLIINFVSGSSFSADTDATVSVTCVDVSQVTSSVVIGSYNEETGAYKGLENVKMVYPKTGCIPAILCAPGYSTESSTGIALTAKAKNINGVFQSVAILDIDTEEASTYGDVADVKASSGYTSSYCYNVWPCCKVDGKVIAGSAVAAAVMMYTDAQREGVPSTSPSNKATGIDATCLADGTEVLLDRDQANVVNSCGVATFLNMGGWRLWGSYTGAFPENTDPKDIWISSRRMLNWQSNNFIVIYSEKVDNPLDLALIESVVDEENIRTASFVPTYMAAAEIQYNESDNSESDILAGKITFRQKIAPYIPAQEIVNIVSYDTTAIMNALLGGE